MKNINELKAQMDNTFWQVFVIEFHLCRASSVHLIKTYTLLYLNKTMRFGCEIKYSRYDNFYQLMMRLRLQKKVKSKHVICNRACLCLTGSLEELVYWFSWYFVKIAVGVLLRCVIVKWSGNCINELC